MYNFTIEDHPSSADVAVLSQGLSAHSLPHTHAPGFQSIASLMRDETGTLVGGVWGYINWNWLSVGLVWVSEELRGGGYGKQLLLALEDEARTRGCQFAHLDTFSYQARPFYEKLGYEVFAILDNYPAGQQRFFMKKALS
ncbi:MAG: GNAT family N-acetyltransferase [Blastocatellia bacterium]|nr:GNAT family N-acetyltransferase [Blastocatellia bacterium]